ncbi:MAG TPA: hypothetical protein PKO06_22295, partial [Candidatus Ozemobacteraceae bacterium]|nr:hypothetical protein [Candidatus Ozemobacteraceae bacterium]
MPTITEGDLTFAFPAGWQVTAYDQWSYYRNQFSNVGGEYKKGIKGVDILAKDPQNTTWLIEVKDYRRSCR